MKNNLWSYIVLLILAVIINTPTFAQATVTKELMISRAKGIYKAYYANGTTYVGSSIYDLGTSIQSGTRTCYRSVWTISLPTTLETGSYAEDTEIEYSISTSNNVKIGILSGYTSSVSNDEAWALTENGTILSTLSGGSRTISLASLVPYIRTAQDNSQSQISLYFMSDNENIACDIVEITAVNYINVSYSVKPNYIFENNFGAGSLTIDGTNRNNGYSERFYKQTTHIFTAIEPQTNSGDNYIWNDTEAASNLSDWHLNKADGSFFNLGNTQTINHQATGSEHNSTIVANLRKKFDYTFTNQLSGTTQTGQFTINNTVYSSPTATITAVEGNTLSVAAVYQYDNFDTYFSYRFYQWSDGITEFERTITPSQSQNLTAIYKKVPKFTLSVSNLQVTSSSDNHVKLTWTDHPDAGVTGYQIWKRVRYKNDVMQDETPVEYAYVRSGVGYFVDPNLTFNEDSTEDKYWVSYCVVACYTPDQTTSPVTIWTSYFNAWTDDGPGTLPIDKQLSSNQTVIVNEYSLKNYPNPFNPTTQIEYSIKEDGFVTIKIYDITGKEITTLVNKPLSKGVYKTEFNASNMASGVYIYTIKVNNFFSAQKMILAR